MTLFAVSLILPSAAAAQSRDLRVRVGLGGEWRPKFPGADDNEIAPKPDFSVARGDDQFAFEAPDDSFSPKLISSGPFALGPAAALARGRKDKDVGRPVGKVGTTLELGGFAEFELADSLRLRGELRKGINGHEGLVGSVGADQIWRDGDRYVVSVGPRLLWADARYHRAFFGVTPATALASGLPAYRPGNGIYGAAIQAGATTQLGPRFGMFGGARYERLVGDAARSPIVRTLGSRNQWTASLGLTYTFRIKRRD